MSDLNTLSYTLILCSATCLGIKAILPDGAKSALYGPMKFLLSLVLLLTVLSPLVSLLSKSPISFSFPITNSSDVDQNKEAENIILEKSTETITVSVQSAFPAANFSLNLQTDVNLIPTGILVYCEDLELGKRICSFLEQNYSILSTLQTRKDDDR